MNPQVKIILSDDREINIELFPEIAPTTVENFLKLVNNNFYNGTIFHRVIKDFMIQTGGYYVENNTLHEKPDVPSIKGEFSLNGFENNLKHELGIISMARTNDPNSASSQFFICSYKCPHLDGQYAAFGKVIDDKSLSVVLSISNSQTTNIGYGFSDFPIDLITIKTIIRTN